MSKTTTRPDRSAEEILALQSELAGRHRSLKIAAQDVVTHVDAIDKIFRGVLVRMNSRLRRLERDIKGLEKAITIKQDDKNKASAKSRGSRKVRGSKKERSSS